MVAAWLPRLLKSRNRIGSGTETDGREASAVIGTAALAAGFVSPVMFFGSTVLVGLGNGLTMPSINTGAMSVRPKLAGTATSLNGALIVGTVAALATPTGQAVPQQGAALPLLFLMLMSSGAGLIAVLFAMFRQVAEPK